MEACGVIAGVAGRAVRVYRMGNVAEESRKAYRFNTIQQLQVFSEIEDEGWELLAFFHSHPRSRAYPSHADVMQAHRIDDDTGEIVALYPDTRYLILSLASAEPDLRAFTFADGIPVEEEVEVTDGGT